MLKLRTKNNKRYKVADDVVFIEICDGEGNLGAIIHVMDNGVINISLPGEPTFSNYVKLYGSKTTHFIDHKQKNTQQ